MRISDWSSDVCSSDLVEVDRELLERAFALGLVGLGGFLVVGALGGRRFGGRAALADAVADEADRVEPAHILLLEEIDRIALTLGEQGDEHVGAGHLVAARRLDVQDRALDDALEPARPRSEEHTSELQSLLRISYADFCLQK